jgi:hypothetical protein
MSNYRKIWENYYGLIPIDEKGRSYEIHHIDGNKNCVGRIISETTKEKIRISALNRKNEK